MAAVAAGSMLALAKLEYYDWFGVEFIYLLLPEHLRPWWVERQ